MDFERAHDLDSPEARMTTAVHEAAHAVVALRLGLPLSSLTLRSPAAPASDDGGGGDSFDSMLGSSGLSLPADYSDEGYPELARGQTVAALAGPLAEIRFCGTLDLLGAMGDIVEAASSVEALSRDRGAIDLGRECQREALAIVKQNWETIVAVAAELAKAPDEMLDGDAVREAVRSAEPATRL